MKKRIVSYELILEVSLTDGCTVEEVVIGRTRPFYEVPEETVEHFSPNGKHLPICCSFQNRRSKGFFQKEEWLVVVPRFECENRLFKRADIQTIKLKRVMEKENDFPLNYLLDKLPHEEAIEFLKDNTISIKL